MNLVKKAQSSIIWNTLFNIFKDIVNFCVMLILVRLLSPDDYGQFTLVTNIIGVIAAFSFQGLVSHAIQVRREDEVQWQIYFTAGRAIQFLLFVITNIIALALATFEEYVAIAPLIHLSSVLFLMEWPTEISIKMLERELDWKRRRLLHGLSLLVTSIIAIIMGLSGFGVYALIVPGLLINIPFIYDLFLRRKWRPTWEWNIEKIRPAFQFGLNRVGSGLIIKGRPLLETTAIVHILGFASAGFFGRVIGLGNLFTRRIAIQIMYAVYPVLTKIDKNTDKYRKMSGLVFRAVAWGSIPIGVIFSILAMPIVNTIYGDKWLSIVPLVPFAMIISVITALSHVLYTLLLGQDNQKKCLLLDIITLIFHIPILLFSISDGLYVYLQYLLLLEILIFVIATFWLSNTEGVRYKSILDSIVYAVLASFISASAFGGLFYVLGVNLDQFLTAFIFGIMFFIGYILSIRLFFLRSLNELLIVLPGRSKIRRVLYIK
jgi:teichuronic acid exporter